MKPAASVFVTVPRELLPDVLELVTDAYVRQQATLAKNERTISDLQFQVSDLKGKLKIFKTLDSLRKAKEAENGDDF